MQNRNGADNSSKGSRGNGNGAAGGNNRGSGLNYGKLLSMLFVGGERIDRRLRQNARQRNEKARHRRPQEVVFEWVVEQNSFRIRLYTTLDVSNLAPRADRTGKAKIRLVVRDLKSKREVEAVSGNVETLREGESGWESKLSDLLNNAFLFVWRRRPRCPLCRDAEMEVRTGSRGEFWGCEAFPKCTGTRAVHFIPVAPAANSEKSTEHSSSGGTGFSGALNRAANSYSGNGGRGVKTVDFGATAANRSSIK